MDDALFPVSSKWALFTISMSCFGLKNILYKKWHKNCSRYLSVVLARPQEVEIDTVWCDRTSPTTSLFEFKTTLYCQPFQSERFFMITISCFGHKSKLYKRQHKNCSRCLSVVLARPTELETDTVWCDPTSPTICAQCARDRVSSYQD